LRFDRFCEKRVRASINKYCANKHAETDQSKRIFNDRYCFHY